ncbi:hypothetical protein [Chamaesiphon sp.]|uniref:hypothetical protein n=1 Tax=Chamaesiphon sp. TaxID=2814140 RepID=UPI0035930ABE
MTTTITKPDLVKTALQDVTIRRSGDRYLVCLQGNVDRITYTKVKNVLSRLGGKWNTKQQAHLHSSDPSQGIETFLSTGYLPPLNPHAYFPTPIKTVDEAIEFADIRSLDGSNLRFLEPSAGCGRICQQVRSAYPNISIECIELDPKNRSILKDRGFQIVAEDFETFEPPHLYDFVLMNPPFLGKTYQHHIQKAYSLLRDGGILTAILPASYRDDRLFRNWIFELGETEFLGSVFEDTNVECEMVRIDKGSASTDWLPTDCYASTYHRDIQLTLDSSYHQLESPSLADISKIVDDQIKLGFNLLWNDKVQRQTLNPLSTAN